MSDQRELGPATAARFRVRFKTDGGGFVAYSVCTWLGESKAIIIAAETQGRRGGDDRLYALEKIEPLPGSDPLPADLVDRTEW